MSGLALAIQPADAYRLCRTDASVFARTVLKRTGGVSPIRPPQSVIECRVATAIESASPIATRSAMVRTQAMQTRSPVTVSRNFIVAALAGLAMLNIAWSQA